MILQNETLRPMVCGAAEMIYEEGMHRFSRHTPEQVGYYRRNEGALIRALAPAGVCIDLRTDADAVRFFYRYEPGSSRNICMFDVQADGITVASPGVTGCEAGKGEVCVRLPAGDKRLTVWMPCLKQVWIGSVELVNASYADACAENGVLLTLGDSITQGYDAVHPSGTYAARLAQKLNLQLINQSVGGAVFDPSSLMKLPGGEPEIVTCWYGTNDWNGRQREEFLREMAAYIEKLTLLYSCSRLFVITPLFRADAAARGQTACGTIEQVAQDIRAVCAAFPAIRVIDGDALMPHDADLFADGYLHPTDAGFAFIADNLACEIDQFC